ncbi:hypothetical protein EVAR_77028_1 [Eumeta japonica]|uniref:Uncharacterized protein n=1 Tax=Eumeta variegata TaxID=151549 RepID=A0A4C1T0C3_EUMVA|nr:hypothetical protein EVAR_77028_1 [Eumeta japonica]
MLATLAEDHDLIIAPPTPTYLPANVRHRPNILDLAILKGGTKSELTETVHCLGSDHSTRTAQTRLLHRRHPNLNVIPDDIVSNNDIDTAIGALTKHIRSVKGCQRKVPANSDRRGLPADVRELIRAKNAAPISRAHTPLPNIGLEREASNAK